MKMRVYIIAEIGVNHNGSMEMAKALIDAASDAGADAIKIQSFNTDSLMLRNTPKADYQRENTMKEEGQYQMVKALELGEAQQRLLMAYATGKGIEFLSSPFDSDSLDFLVDRLQLPIIKIASGEITNGPLLLRAAVSGKRIILSTGMATLGEIEEALGVIAYGYLEGKNALKHPTRQAFKTAFLSERGKIMLQRVALLHCTTEYPAPFNECNLRAMVTLKQAFGLTIGFSDHTEGIALPMAAVALGADIIEKHITLNRELPGPDHRASLEPMVFSKMVEGIRQVEKALGSQFKGPTAAEIKNLKAARKSIVAVRDIPKGELLTAENIAIKRPGDGPSPMLYWELLGQKAEKTYRGDEVLR